MTGVENFKIVTNITKIKNELKEYDFKMKLIRDAESYIAIAGDGEAVYLLYLLLPTRKIQNIKKTHLEIQNTRLQIQSTTIPCNI